LAQFTLIMCAAVQTCNLKIRDDRLYCARIRVNLVVTWGIAWFNSWCSVLRHNMARLTRHLINFWLESRWFNLRIWNNWP